MEIVEVFNHKQFDVYRVDVKQLLTTREITIMIDFEHGEIAGDCIAFGEWYDLSIEDCKEILKAIPIEKRLRNFENLL